MTTKIDFKRQIDAYRATRRGFRIVDVPDLQYLMIDGHGDPNSGPAFTEAAEASLRLLAAKPDDPAALVCADVHHGTPDDLAALRARVDRIAA